MQSHLALQQRALALIEQLRQSLIAPAFCGRHRRRPTDFTRECVLTFPVLMLLLLQKSLKSLQTHAQEFFWQLSQGVAAPSLSAGAVTHARAKLRPSAFVELNQGVLHTVYGPAHAGLAQRWHGHRLLGVDSSLVRLPSHAAVGEKFGWVQCANHHGLQERYPQGRVSVFYDVLNEVALEARWPPRRWRKPNWRISIWPACSRATWSSTIAASRGIGGWWRCRRRAHIL